MFASLSRCTRRSSTVCTTLLWLVASAFVLRALLPTGYMADTDALRRGSIAIAFCTADGTLTAIPFKPAAPPHTPEGDAPYAHCPYGAFTPLVRLDPPKLADIALQVIPAPQRVATAQHDAPVPVAGPPLGSRAPPAIRSALLA